LYAGLLSAIWLIVFSSTSSPKRLLDLPLSTFLRFGTPFHKMEEKSMSVTQLTSKGQILVPKHLRRKLGLKPGGKVHLDEEEGRLVLTPVPPDPIEAATGFLKGRFSLSQDLRREHREEARCERKARSR
jgi:AbrB family looped-hinge helix DNA binding protein